MFVMFPSCFVMFRHFHAAPMQDVCKLAKQIEAAGAKV